MTDEPTIAVLDVALADVALNPTRTRVWAPIGVPWPVETPGTNQGPPRFGAVNRQTGDTYFAKRPRQRSQDFQAFVDQTLLPAHPDVDCLILLVDGASIYKSKRTRAWLRDRPQVVLVPLPLYAPEVNVQEHLWRWLRAEVTHNHAFGSFPALLAAVDRFCAKLQAHPEQVRQRLGRTAPSLLDRHFAKVA